MSRPIDRPIFFVGMPRSGTTVVFEAFAARRDVAWLSQYFERAPGVPLVALLSRATDVSQSMRRTVSRSDQDQPWFAKLRVGPSEAYEFWQRCCGDKFLYDYLLGAEASAQERGCVRSTVAKVLRYQGKPRFAAKVTGPGRIGYLTSIFPDARFVHVVRDGRAVTRSLMKVGFWQERDRMHRPAWENGLIEADLADWERHDRSPLALAAVQWRRVLTATRDEAERLAPDRYAEVSYEQFVTTPGEVLGAIASFCELPGSPEAEDFLATRFALRDMNYQWREQLEPSEVGMLNDLLADTLAGFGYGVDPPGTPSAPVLTRPFAR